MAPLSLNRTARPRDAEPLERPRIAIAEDDAEIRSALAAMFAMEGFEVTSLGDGEQFVEYLEHCRVAHRLPHVIILDHRMPGWCGLDILEGIKVLGWSTPVIVMSAFGPEVIEPARKMGATAIFEKPFEPDDLQTAVRYLSGVHPPLRRVPRPWPWRVNDTCAACGSSIDIRCEARVPGVSFCATCWERAAPPSELDDLGVGD